ncbi:hypothetical protein [Brevibacterium linens]|uniref:hypothetical protein n=1 Tax=Brevibacterium linens TaxID=1703 RepID=UPI003F88D77A
MDVGSGAELLDEIDGDLEALRLGDLQVLRTVLEIRGSVDLLQPAVGEDRDPLVHEDDLRVKGTARRLAARDEL